MKSACSCLLFLYADDSALMVSHKDKSVVENVLSLELFHISRWFSDNRLSLHLGKTEAIHFESKYKLKKATDINIMVGDTEIQAKESVNYLGCVLDNLLSVECVTQPKNQISG